MQHYSEEIKHCLEILQSGGVILTPTDTIWGLSCDATNQEAVQRLADIKQRGAGKSFIILLDADYKIERYVAEVPAVAYDLIEYAAHPLTLIFPGARNLAPAAVNQDGSVGIRVVKQFPFLQKLLERFKKPLVSTSANISGNPFPRSYEEIDPRIVTGVQHAVPRKFEIRSPEKPSTIMRMEPDGQFRFIRR